MAPRASDYGSRGARDSAVWPSAIPPWNLSRCSCGWPCHRLLNDRQIDNGRDHAEQHTQPPHDVIGTGPLEQHTTKIDAEEPADLMAEECDAEQHCKPARAEHQ